MPSLLQQLENNEAILLMYLADELSGEDRVEVDQMLATDAGLRAELEQLRAADGVMSASLEAWDDANRTAVSEPVALRQTSRLMKQWQVQRAIREPVPVPVTRGLRYPWWAYPSAAAAAIILALSYWGLRSDGPGTRYDSPGGLTYNSSNDPNSIESPEQRQMAEQLRRSFASDDLIEDPSSNHPLGDVERQMKSLAESADEMQILFPEDL